MLSSWKEIAAHFGKGVRTVQRWERELGLPVHRPSSGRKHIVIAYPDELDGWIRHDDTVRGVEQPESPQKNTRGSSRKKRTAA